MACLTLLNVKTRRDLKWEGSGINRPSMTGFLIFRLHNPNLTQTHRDAGGGYDGGRGDVRRRGGHGTRGHALRRQGEVLPHLGLFRGLQGWLVSMLQDHRP